MLRTSLFIFISIALFSCKSKQESTKINWPHNQKNAAYVFDSKNPKKYFPNYGESNDQYYAYGKIDDYNFSLSGHTNGAFAAGITFPEGKLSLTSSHHKKYKIRSINSEKLNLKVDYEDGVHNIFYTPNNSTKSYLFTLHKDGALTIQSWHHPTPKKLLFK